MANGLQNKLANNIFTQAELLKLLGAIALDYIKQADADIFLGDDVIEWLTA